MARGTGTSPTLGWRDKERKVWHAPNTRQHHRKSLVFSVKRHAKMVKAHRARQNDYENAERKNAFSTSALAAGIEDALCAEWDACYACPTPPLQGRVAIRLVATEDRH